MIKLKDMFDFINNMIVDWMLTNSIEIYKF